MDATGTNDYQDQLRADPKRVAQVLRDAADRLKENDGRSTA